jgi:hypothetical protein
VWKETPDEKLKLDGLGITLEELKTPDAYKWVGRVRWIADCDPFSAKGDSGALVYAVADGATVPLGIHIGRPVLNPKCSFFLGLESFYIEGQLH